MLKENVILIVFLIFGISFVVSMNIRGYHIMKLNRLLKKKYPLLDKRLNFFNIGYGLFLYRPIKLFKYTWFEKSYPKDILPIIKKVRFFQLLGTILFVLTIISPFFVEVFY